MARPGPQTFAKRQREMAKKEKRRAKQEKMALRREMRKAEREGNPIPGSESVVMGDTPDSEVRDIEDIEAMNP